MSWTSQGDGWWRASDGLWYPPEKHPDRRRKRSTTPRPPRVASVRPERAERTVLDRPDRSALDRHERAERTVLDRPDRTALDRHERAERTVLDRPDRTALDRHERAERTVLDRPERTELDRNDRGKRPSRATSDRREDTSRPQRPLRAAPPAPPPPAPPAPMPAPPAPEPFPPPATPEAPPPPRGAPRPRRSGSALRPRRSSRLPQLIALGIGALVVFRVLASVSDSVDSNQSTTESEPADTQSDQPSFDGPLLATGEVFQVTTVDQWRGTIYGYVFGSTAAFEDPPGSCITVLGAMTADEVGNDLVSDGIAAPTVGAIAAGTYFGSDVGRCDEVAFDEAGWSPRSDARITVGTFYPFRATVYLPPGVDPGVQALVVGDGSGQQVAYVPDEFADVVAAPVGEAGPSAAVGRQLRPVGDAAAAAFDVGADFYGVSWQGTIAGMVEVDPLSGFDGRCLVVLGTLTGFVDDNGSGFFAPPISAIVGGRDQPGPGLDCSIDDVQAAGYVRLGDLPPFEGTPLPFFEAIPLPAVLFGAILTNPEMVVVGSALDPAAALFEPTVLDTIPAP